MNIKSKNIIESKEKICCICNKVDAGNGITILGSFICDECIDKITAANVYDSTYYKLKERIKKILINKL